MAAGEPRRVGTASAGSGSGAAASSAPATAPLTAPLDRGLRRWVGVTPGQLLWAALTVIVLTGIPLGVVYDPATPLAAVEAIGEAVPFGWLLRATHRLAAQLFLVVLLLHTADHVLAGNHRHLRPRKWWPLVAVLALSFGAMFGGFLLRGDAEAYAAHAIAVGVTRAMPGVGSALADWLWGWPGEGLHAVYLHHLVTFTLVPWLLSIEHGRRSWAGWLVTAGVGALVVAAALAHHPGPGAAVATGGEPLWGPWYFVGLQELLRWLPVWLAAWLLPLSGLVALGALGWARPEMAAGEERPSIGFRAERVTRWALLLAGVGYAAVSLISLWVRSGR